MKGIHFEIDEELYRQLKIKVAKKGLKLKDYFSELIEKDLKKED